LQLADSTVFGRELNVVNLAQANILDHENHPDPTIIMPSPINTSSLKDMGLAGSVENWHRGCLEGG
jgi:hypothetical protein